MIIGVFDSGIGGRSIADVIETALPEHTVLFRNDQDHVPYGSRTKDELLALITPIITDMVAAGCQVIVLACNTISTLLVNELRSTFDVPFIALEPMVKPAAEQTTSKIIAVCATPATLASPRYDWLKQTYATDCTVIEPDCSQWATMVETNQINHDQINQIIESVIEKGADVIVLGCTHYHWIEDDIKRIAANRAQVIQPEQAIIQRLTTVLAQLT